MAPLVECPACARQLRLPDDLSGRHVQCPACGHQLLAGDGPQSPSGPGDVYAVVEEETPAGPTGVRRCPACGESNRPGVRRCLFCGQPFGSDGESGRPRPRRQLAGYAQPHRGGIVLTLGILSIVLPVAGPVCGIIAWVMGNGDLRKMRQGVMDREGMGLTQAGWICGIIGTVLGGVQALFCCGYFLLVGAVFTAAENAAHRPANPWNPRPTNHGPEHRGR